MKGLLDSLHTPATIKIKGTSYHRGCYTRILLAALLVCWTCLAFPGSARITPRNDETRKVLQRFADNFPHLADEWLGYSHSSWNYCLHRKYIECDDDTGYVTFSTEGTSNVLVGSLPEIGNDIDGANVWIEKIFLGVQSGLRGTIPSSLLTHLPNLKDLRLYSTSLGGTLPDELYDLSQLNYLALDNCRFTGTLSERLTNLPKLTKVFLQGNQLSSTLPTLAAGMPSLAELWLDHNQFTGLLQPDWVNLPLQALTIAGNKLCHCVPSSYRRSSVLMRAMNEMDSTGQLFLSDACASVNSCLTPHEKASTVAFLRRFPRTIAGLRDTWTGDDYCAWPGVTCAVSGPVTVYIDGAVLTATGVAGSLPELTDDIIGSDVAMPSFAVNGLGGPLPASFASLSRVESVNLQGNDFCCAPQTWSEHAALSAALRALGSAGDYLLATDCSSGKGCLTEAQFTTTSGFLKQIGGAFTELQKAWAGLLDGTTDYRTNTLAGLQYSDATGLATLYISRNYATLTGKLPNVEDVSGEDVMVDRIYMYGFKGITGTLPESFGTLSQLRGLWLHSTGLGGTLPDSFGASLPRLAHLALQNTSLSGTLPDSLSQLSSLDAIFLNNNNFTGSLPTFPPATMRKLGALWFGGNNFTGSVPENWASLPAIRAAQLEGLRLCGCLPASWRNSTALLKAVRRMGRGGESLMAPDCEVANSC